MNIKLQSYYLSICTCFLGLLIFFTYTFIPLNQFLPAGVSGNPTIEMAGWMIGLISGAICLILYTVIGLLALLLARQLGLPGIYRPDSGWKISFFRPLVIGLGMGVGLIIIDRIFPLDPAVRAVDFHPPFPLSILASLSAGIGEEIIFRGLMVCLWAFLFNLALKRWKLTQLALWIGNIFGAFSFGAAHFGSVMILMGVQSPAQLPISLIVYILLLNGILGLAAGKIMMKDGLIAAMGIHFWADILWHVIWPAVLALAIR